MEREGLCQRTGVNLTDYQIEVIRRHASSESDSPELQRDCAEFASLGRSVMACTYTIHMYVEEGVRDKDELSKRLNAFLAKVTSELGITDGCPSPNEMETVLTRISYVEEQPGAVSNDELRVIGAKVLDMLANECVYCTSEPEPVGVSQAVAALTVEDRIGKVTLNILMDSIRKGRSFNDRVAINVASVIGNGGIAPQETECYLSFCVLMNSGADAHASRAVQVAIGLEVAAGTLRRPAIERYEQR